MLCTSNIIALQSGALQTNTYLWQDGSSNPTLSVQTSGVYSVQTININNCIAQDTVNVIVAGVGLLWLCLFLVGRLLHPRTTVRTYTCRKPDRSG